MPFFGTCGGFLHMMIEYARNVLKINDADHAELNPNASNLLVAPLTCSVSEQNHTFILRPDSKVAVIYGTSEITEQYGICKYGLNPQYYTLFEKSELSISGLDIGGEVRIMELKNHPFYIGTLFQPERSAFKNIIHPLIKAFLQCALDRE